ncbi:MAG TPA: TIGR03086 family metal-binding protein [Mycobacteriales bacterium]|nr:TIGR03086 family metal-binding protein [Mycobacteriales bacterium]
MSQVIEQFHRVADGFAARIEATPVDAWTTPSPCPGWTAREVVEHVVGGIAGVMASITGRTPEPVTAQTDLAATWRELEQAVTAALSDPETAGRTIQGPLGEMTLEQAVARLGTVELLVHTWDLARAVGGDERLDPDLVRSAFEALRPLDSMLRTPRAFGPKLEPPEGADEQTEFLCFLGRRV